MKIKYFLRVYVRDESDDTESFDTKYESKDIVDSLMEIYLKQLNSGIRYLKFDVLDNEEEDSEELQRVIRRKDIMNIEKRKEEIYEDDE